MALRSTGTGDAELDRYLSDTLNEVEADRNKEAGMAGVPTPASASTAVVPPERELPPPVSMSASLSASSNPFLKNLVDSGGAGLDLDAPPESGGDGHGFNLRSAWDNVIAPVNAITGLSGTSAIHALGIPQMFPGAYEKAKTEKIAGITGGVDRPLGPLETAESFPGLGDVATAEWDPDTLPGRIARPIAQLGLNIAGDPLTYVGPGLAKLTKVGRAAEAVKAAALGAEVATGAGDLAKAAELSSAVPSLSTALEAARAGEGGGARLARHALGAVAFPYTPMGGLAYAPGIIESTYHGAAQSYEDARAGRYKEAAASGVGALMTAALGSLVAKGLIDERKAAGVLERAIGKTLGEVVPNDLPQPIAAPPPPPTAGVPPMSGDRPEVVHPGAAPETVTPQPQGEAVVPPVSGGPSTPEPAGVERPTFDPSSDLHAKQQKTLQLLSSKGPEDLVTKRELFDAGLITRRQFKDGRMETLLTDLGVPDLAGRLERAKGVSGGGFRIKAGGGEEAQVAPAPTDVPSDQPATPPSAGIPEGANANANASVPQPAATTAPKLTRAEIDRQLENPDLREMTRQTLEELAGDREGGIHALTPEDVRAAFPGDENKGSRAVLNRSLEAMKKIKRVGDEEADAARAKMAVVAPTETGSDPHKLSSTQVDLPAQTAADIRKIADTIPDSELADDGRESRPHVTVKYGLHSNDVEPVKTLLADESPVKVKLGKTSIFEPEGKDYDVVKVDVDSPDLHRLNDKIASSLPVTDTHPTYQPHATVAYVKKGQGKKYVGDASLEGREITLDKIQFSDQDGNVHEIPLTKLPPGGVRESRLTAQPTHKGNYPTRIQEPNLDILAERRGTSGPEAVGSRVETVRRSIADYVHSHDLDPAQFTAAAERVLGKDIDGASTGELHHLLSYADRHPDEFGGENAPTIDTAEVQKAASRLMGGTSHIDFDESKIRDFRYDPSSPAGSVQKWARVNGLEESLQDTITDWLSIIAGHGSDRPRKNLDALKSNLDRLMTMEDETAARKELTKLLQKDMKFKQQNERAKEQRHQRLSAQAAEGLSPNEAKRFAATPEESVSTFTSPERDAAFEPPQRPADTVPKDWRIEVKGDPELTRQYRSWLADIAGQREEAMSTGGVSRSGTAGVETPWLKEARQLAADLNIPHDSRRSGDRLLQSIYKALKDENPHAAKIGDLLTDEMVAKNGPQYRSDIARGLALGDGDARIANIEGDATSARMMAPLQQIFGHTADAFSRTVNDLANAVGLPSKFGGFTPSSKLDGIRIGDDVFLNPAHSYHKATAEMAGSALEGGAHADALSYQTSKNLVDTMLHEITHKKARHDAATGDLSFAEAYARATEDAGPLYHEAIRSIQSAIEHSLPTLEKDVAPIYKEALGAGTEAAAIAGPGAEARNDAGASPRRITPIPDRSGGGSRGAVGGVGDGDRSTPALPGGEPKPSSTVREGAGAGEGVAASTGADGRGEPGRGDGDSIDASLTEDLSKALSTRRATHQMKRVEKAFAASQAQFSGQPIESADDILRRMENVDKLPDTVKRRLMEAGPKSEFNIGLNMKKIAPEVMSDLQRQTVAATLWLRNNTETRATPVRWEDVKSDMRALLQTHTPEEFAKFMERTGLRDPRDYAALSTIHATFSEDVEKALTSLRAAEIRGDDVAKAASKEALAMAWAKRAAVESTLIPEKTNVARMLSFFKTIAHPLTSEENFKSRFFGAMRAARIQDEKAKELYSLLSDTLSKGPAGDWTTFTNAFREATQAKKFDKFLEFWKAGLLGWTTQIGNVASNTVMLGLRNSEHAAAALVDSGISAITGAPRTRQIGEVAARMTGLKHALADAIPMLKGDLIDIFRLKEPDVGRRLNEGSFYDEPDIRRLYGAIEGKKGEFIRIPFKLLDAADNFFKHIARTQEYAAQSHRLGLDPKMRTPGENVSHATARIFTELRRVAADPFANSHLYEKPGYKEALMAGRKAATADTFQSQLGPVIQKAYESTQAHPALQFLFPFVKAPYNIIAEGLKRTPLGALQAIHDYRVGKISNPQLVENMVKSAIGTSIMGVMAGAAMDGTVTGGGPADPKERELLKRTGWQPYSIKVGGGDGSKAQYISYQRLEPFATILGLASDLGEAWKTKDTDTTGELMTKAVASLSDNITNKSFLTGLESLVKIITDPAKQGATAIRQLQSSLIPNIIGVVPFAHATRVLDDKYRETEAFTTSPFVAQIPGLSTTLPEQKTPTGETRKRVGSAFERMFSPFQRSEERTDPIASAAKEIARLGISVESPPLYTKVGQDKIYYTVEEREQIAKAQQRAMEKIASLTMRSEYGRLPDQPELVSPERMTKVKAIRSIISRYRDPVRESINRQAVRRERMSQR